MTKTKYDKAIVLRTKASKSLLNLQKAVKEKPIDFEKLETAVKEDEDAYSTYMKYLRSCFNKDDIRLAFFKAKSLLSYSFLAHLRKLDQDRIKRCRNFHKEAFGIESIL